MEECARAEPLIWRKWVGVSGRAVEVEEKEGEDTEDAIFQGLQPLDVLSPYRRKMMDASKNNVVPHSS